MALPEAYAGSDRDEQYRYGLKWARPLMEETTHHANDSFTFETHENAPINASPFGLHTAMFIPTIRFQGNVEQQRHWLPLAESGKIIGTYAQTELGHGGFVRGLETVFRLLCPCRDLALLTGHQDSNLRFQDRSIHCSLAHGDKHEILIGRTWALCLTCSRHCAADRRHQGLRLSLIHRTITFIEKLEAFTRY